MNSNNTIYIPTRGEWREWLSEHFDSASEIWLVSYRKHTGRPSIPYHEAVEEALCFGWIDSTRRTIDGDSYAQRFSPRRRGSGYSQTNKERIARLRQQGKIIPSVLEQLLDVHPEDFVIPDDIRAALEANSEAWAFFRSTPPAYQRIRAAYVDHARSRPEEFEKRLSNLVEKSTRRQMFGYGIEAFFDE